jgi:anaerobic magnesium-protoporphyrin IX monomethyl ester cyclase
MSDILFIHPTDSTEYNLGIAIISAVVKEKGFTSELFMLDFRRPVEMLDTELVAKIQTEQPLLIAISVMSTYWKPLDSWLHRLKELSPAPILVGGWHPTLAPAETLEHLCVDYICLGEGEFATLELIQALKTHQDTTTIQNLWMTSKGEIIKNPLRPPIPDLNILPAPDYDLFNYQTIIKRRTAIMLGELGPSGAVPYMAGRGCAYRCTYCSNHAYQKCYDLPAKHFIRRRSVPLVIADLEKLVADYDAQWIEFWDEDITLDAKWFKEFSQQYPRRIGLPFSVAARPNNVQGNQFETLRKIGCKLVMMGIECGNENYRKKYLKRNVTNKQITQAFALAREHGIMTLAFNIMGMPFETEREIADTIALNEQIEPDYFLFFVYNPFQGTELFQMAKNAGLLKNYKLTGYNYQGNGINVQGIDTETFNKLHEKAGKLQIRLDERRKQCYPNNFPNVQVPLNSQTLYHRLRSFFAH